MIHLRHDNDAVQGFRELAAVLRGNTRLQVRQRLKQLEYPIFDLAGSFARALWCNLLSDCQHVLVAILIGHGSGLASAGCPTSTTSPTVSAALRSGSS